MKRIGVLTYGIGCYSLFLAVYAYAACFFANVGVVKTIDAPLVGTRGAAVAVNFGLLLVFAVQHSVMARPAFKRVWTRFVPEAVERSTYVLASTAALALLLWQWRPLGSVVWNVADPSARAAIWTLFACGWLGVPLVTLLFNHFDLFGLRQVWFAARGVPYEPLPFRTPGAYRWVRHPLYVAWTVAFWATPTMTAGHMLMATGLTMYMLTAAMLWEEPDLVAHFGERYRTYQREVPMFIPRLQPWHDDAALTSSDLA